MGRLMKLVNLETRIPDSDNPPDRGGPKSQRVAYLKSMKSGLPKVLLTHSLMPRAQARLEKATNIQLLRVQPPEDRPSLLAALKQHKPDGLLCFLVDKIDGELLDAAGPQLKLVSTVSVGYDHISTQELKKRGIKLGNTPDVLTDSVSEVTVLLTLMATRRVKESVSALSNGEWGKWSMNWLLGMGLSGKTVGFVGFGRIAQKSASIFKSFGVGKIVYHGPRSKPGTDASYYQDLSEMLPKCDVVIVLCALNDQTHRLMDYAKFSLMKPTAYFVNAARGGIVNQNDLARALKVWISFVFCILTKQDGKLAGAALDVMEQEPIPPNDPLVNVPNLTLLPHIGSSTEETREAMASVAVDNMLQGIHDMPMPAQVNL